ncbi:MAG: CoA-binding protein [Candidatus Helarchaeota archaeon]|nr:CoA-binding protein [Candidatus Helarchaeota archaeon]
MEYFFNPKSVAVIGASRNEKRPGHNVLKNLVDLGYKGKIYPINPNVDNLLGLQVYPSIKDIPDPVELAVIIIPTSLVPKALKECAKKGVKGAVITTEGFAETGEIELQHEIKQITRDTGIRVIGPGSMGIVNLEDNFTSSYADFKGLDTTGNITFIAQSGIFTGGLVRYFATFDIPVSRVISLGNKVDVDDADVLNFLADDPKTSVIALYIEGINDGKRFLQAAKTISKEKPVVVLKGGTTPAGARAASSHTGSIAVDVDIFSAVMKQSGFIQVDSLSELFETARAFSLTPILPKGPRIAVLTYSGCLGVVSADTALKLGLQMASFTKETSEKIHEMVFDRKFGANPVDTYPATLKKGHRNVFSTCLDAILEDTNVDGCLITVWGDEIPEERPFSPQIRDIILKHQKRGKITIVPVLGEKLGVERERKFFEDNGIITTIFADHAVKIYKNLFQYTQFLKSLE